MTAAYRVVTDWAIHWLHGHEQIRLRLMQLRNLGLALSAISLAELWEGVHYSRSPEQSQKGLDDLLRSVSLVGIDAEMCRLFGEERGRLRA